MEAERKRKVCVRPRFLRVCFGMDAIIFVTFLGLLGRAISLTPRVPEQMPFSCVRDIRFGSIGLFQDELWAEFSNNLGLPDNFSRPTHPPKHNMGGRSYCYFPYANPRCVGCERGRKGNFRTTIICYTLPVMAFEKEKKRYYFSFRSGLTHLKTPHVSWVPRVLETVLIALQKKLEEKPGRESKYNVNQ